MPFYEQLYHAIKKNKEDGDDDDDDDEVF